MASRKPRALRLSDEELEEIQRHADEAGLARSTYMRRASLRNLERINVGPVRHDLRCVTLELAQIADASTGESDEREHPLLDETLRRVWRVLDVLMAARRRARRNEPMQ